MVLIILHSLDTPHPFISYLLEKPALPRPNRMLGGTKLSDDMAPARSAISVSGALSLSGFFSSFCAFGDFGVFGDLGSGCEFAPSASRRLARRRELFVTCELVEDRRRW